MTQPEQAPKLSIMAQNALADPNYCPYCLRCPRAVRMVYVAPYLWKHHCGAVHDERENVAAYLAAKDGPSGLPGGADA